MDEISLDQARASLMAGREQGSICPCCDQVAKAYKRSLYGTTVNALRAIYDKMTAPGADSSIHLGEFLATLHGVAGRGGDTTRLAHWGLLKKVHGKGGGHYAITELGEKFVRGEVSVPKYKWFYNEEVVEGLGEPAPLVYIKEVL